MANRRTFRWPSLLTETGRGIAFGGDYNPDQWSEDVWDDDIRLMKQAGVNTVALAIFSWDRIQPEEHRWEFGWLDRIIDKLGKAGIAVDLASATATAPLWLYEQHPEVLPHDKFGHPVNAGSRQSWSPTSPVFKEYALTLCRKLAERYGNNPYVTAWHMGNEYGWNNRYDYCDNALHAFRAWCERKYGTIDALNAAWGTTFWGQEMNGFDEVLIPRFMGADSMVNPGQKLDFERFGNDMLLDFYKAERDAIAEICPDKPFTTNFMVSTDQCCMDYADWAGEVDFVSNDHYFHEGESHIDELFCSDALMDSLALGKPWYVMEHSTSAVQWKDLNIRKRKGGRHQLLPVASLRVRRRILPLRNGAARRRAYEAVPQRVRAGRRAQDARRCGRAGHRTGAVQHGDPVQRRIRMGHAQRDPAEQEAQPLARRARLVPRVPRCRIACRYRAVEIRLERLPDGGAADRADAQRR